VIAAAVHNATWAILAIGGGVALLITLAAVAALLVGRMRSRRTDIVGANVRSDLQQVLEAVLSPSYQRYLKHSNPADTPDGQGPEEEPLYLRRLRRMLLTPAPTRGMPRIGSDETAIGLAVLEVRINNLAESLAKLENNAVGQSRLAWNILGVLGTVIGIFAGIVAIVAGLTQLL
jgi:hypothetical protein